LRFSGLILENIFMVFLGSSCRETAKNAIKIISMGKDERIFFFPQLFRPKVFEIDSPQKVFYGVFELPLLRNAQKRHKKIKKIKKKPERYPPDLLAICQIYPRFIFFFFGAPRPGPTTNWAIPPALPASSGYMLHARPGKAVFCTGLHAPEVHPARAPVLSDHRRLLLISARPLKM
jgi:hypothetical protein